MGPRATILWTEATAAELGMLRRAGPTAVLESTHRSLLVQRIVAALPHGGVVVVAVSDAEASTALRSGVDEILRAGEISLTNATVALERAGLRFAARAPGASSDADLGAGLLASAVASELNVPLASAVLDCEVLWEALDRTLYANDRLADWGSLNAPIDELRELVALRAAAPSSLELRTRIDALRATLARAGNVVRTFNDLMIAEGPHTRVDQVARAVAELLHAHIAVVGELSLELEACHANVPRGALVAIVSAMVASAVGALHAARVRDGHITVRVFEAEGSVVIEVSDDAAAPGELALGAYGVTLGATGDRLRAVGGELMIDDDAHGKTVRAILPASDGLGVSEAASASRGAPRLLSLAPA
jgi:hypothetical protein